MAAYWLTFRLADKVIGGRDWNARYRAVDEAVNAVATIKWDDPTSFFAFESSNSIDTIAGRLKIAIAPSEDMFLIRAINTQDARICGKLDSREIFTLMGDYLKPI